MPLDERDIELIDRILQPLIERMEGGFARLEGRLVSHETATREGFERVDARFEQMDARFERIEARLDQVVENTGAHWRDHEARIRRIEMSLRPRNGHDDPDDDDDES